MATVTRPATALPDPGDDMDAEQVRDWITNILSFLEGTNLDEANIDLTGTDGIIGKSTAQVMTGLKSWESTAAAAGGVREVAQFGIDPVSGTAADGDGGRLTFYADDDGGAETDILRFDWVLTDASAATEESRLDISAVLAGTFGVIYSGGYSSAGVGSHNFTIRDTAAASVLNVFSINWDPDSGTALDNQGLSLRFLMADDADAQTIFGQIDVIATDVSDASEASSIVFRNQVGGTLTATATIDAGGIDLAAGKTFSVNGVDVGLAYANDGDNRIVTGDGSGGLNGEANLTFDGTTLAVTGAATVSTTLGVTGATALAAKVVIGKTGTDTQDLVIEQSADNSLGGLRIYETGGVDWTALYSSGGVAYLQNQDTYMSLGPNGVAINDGSGNANMTVGLTINQGANDDQILAFKSSDVAHGMTSHAETDTYGKFSKASATLGAMVVTGFGAGQSGLDIQGFYTTTDATKSTAAQAPIRLGAAFKSGTNITTSTANGNLVVISDLGGVGARFIFDVDGDSHQDVGTAWTNFDAYEDVAITRALGMTLSPETIVQTKWDDWGKANKDLVYEVGLMQRLTPEQEANGEHSLVNMTTLAKVHNGAIGQLYASQKDLELMVIEELEQLKAQVNNLLMERN